MDIFFFITSVVTIFLGILLSILLFYLIKTAKNLYKLSQEIKGGFKESGEFIMDLKERLDSNFIFRLFFPLLRRKRQNSKKKEDSETAE